MPRQLTKRESKCTGAVTWQVRARIGTKPHEKPLEIVKSFKLKRDASNFLAKVVQDDASGTAVQQSKVTLNVYLDRWLETSVAQGVRPQTAASYRESLDRYIRPGLGGRRLDQLTALAIQRHLQALADKVTTTTSRDPDTGKRTTIEQHLAPRTIRLAFSILSAALKQAVKWRILAHNPAADVEPPRQPRREMHALGKEEAARFLLALRGTKHEALFVLALATGMRPGEYLGLGWADVDLEKGTVTIQRTLVQTRGKWSFSKSVGTKGRWNFGEPKTSKGRRTLPIPASVVDLLRQHRVHQFEQRLQVANVWEDNDLVFANEIGQPINRYNLVNRHFKPLLKKAGLPTTLRLYDLRHSAATLLLAAGATQRSRASALATPRS